MNKTLVRYAVFAVSVLTLMSILMFHSFHAPSAAAEEQYTFGVAPQFEQRKLHAAWKPIIDELQKRTGLSFKLVTTLKIQDFEKEIARGGFDFVYVNPYQIVQVRKSQGYAPLVCDKAPLHGILVVKNDGPVRTVKDLRGKVVAFPSPNALGASLMMRADLEQVHDVSVIPLYVKTHSSVYLHVIKGLASAGGGVEKTLREQDAAIRDSLRVLYTTRAMPSHPVAAHPRVRKEDREKVRRAFLAMGREPAGRELLSKVPILEIMPVTMGDYLVMVEWGLERYWQPISKED